MKKRLFQLLFAASVCTLGAQSQTLSVSLGQVTVPDDHTIHLTATSTGTVKTKGFQFRLKGAGAWTTTGFTAPFSADITNLTNGDWEYRAFVKGSSDTVFSVIQFVQLALCCEATAGIIYPPVPVDSSKVDVGVVINGIKWATRNVDMPGTFVAKPEDYGMFYQWNRPLGWSTSDPLTASDGVSSWDNSTPSGTSWEAANDVCPTGWRIPTLDEQRSLLSATTWTTQNGVTGRLFTDGSNSLFLPAAGYRYDFDGTLNNAGSDGYYWSSTQNGTSNAYNLSFNSGNAIRDYNNRSYGFRLRCVAE